MKTPVETSAFLFSTGCGNLDAFAQPAKDVQIFGRRGSAALP
jgi:hypothetical protein